MSQLTLQIFLKKKLTLSLRKYKDPTWKIALKIITQKISQYNEYKRTFNESLCVQ